MGGFPGSKPIEWCYSVYVCIYIDASNWQALHEEKSSIFTVPLSL